MDMLYEFEFEEDYGIGKNADEDLAYLLEECEKSEEAIDTELIRKAFELCLQFHGYQKRASGQPYYLHPLKVALILIQEFEIFDTASIIACLLHDTIEDVSGEDKEKAQAEVVALIRNEFGEEVLEMVSSLTKIKHKHTNIQSDKAETHRKLFLALVKDVRVILIKIADRLHNMRTLHYLKEKKQKEIALETLNFYTPFTHRLGLTRIKVELEDRSLYFTDRDAYESIKMALREKRRDFLQYIRVFSEHIQNSLNDEEVKHVLTIMHKHIYEIYQMMQRGRELSEIDNFYSMVITTDSNDKFECYKAHGILVNAFNPVEHLVDYIAQPKINWYQSLNTQLFGPDGKLVEVLIRTQEMDRIAEGGIAANFSIKEGRVRALEISEREIEEWGEWMQDMIEQRGDDALQIIWDSIKNNIFDSELTAYSIDGKMVTLPHRACPIDFAFAMSEEQGLHCISAKVNGKIKSLNYEIMNNDRIEIISSPNASPNPEWENFVISHKAEVALHRYFDKHGHIERVEPGPRLNFNIKLIIRGDDRPGILNEITEAIEQANIKRISLDSSDSDFGGAITLNVKDHKYLNSLFAKILSIDGIKSVEQEEDFD